MSAKVSVKLDAASKILQKRGLGPGGRCQKLLAEEVARLSEPYIPQKTGNLADSVRVEADAVSYTAPYAAEAYYAKDGGRSPVQGPYWTQRMWLDRGREIVRTVAKEAGGAAKQPR